MKTRTILCAAIAAAALAAGAAGAPKNVTLMIAGFGTIESMTEVEKWLGEQLQPRANLAAAPTLTEAEKAKAPELDRETVRVNWETRKLEYLKNVTEIDQENARNKRLLTNLRMKTLATDATRYVPLAKDYLQAALAETGCRLIKVVDRSNADVAAVENALGGGDEGFAAAGCVLTAALGDREESTQTVTVNASGAKVQTTTWVQPYVGKVRDMRGNVLTAFKGEATWRAARNNVVESTVADPARKLVEAACGQIAAKLVEFFTAELDFRVKVPSDLDEDEVTVTVDGREVDAQGGGVKVLAVEHAVVATLEGCDPIKRVVAIEEPGSKRTVKLTFKKKKKAAAADEDAE